MYTYFWASEIWKLLIKSPGVTGVNESRTWHQYFCWKNIPVQWCQRQRLAVEGRHNIFCQREKWGRYAFPFNLSKITLWLRILDTCLTEKLSLDNKWSYVCVSAILYLFGSCNVNYAGLYLIKEGVLVSRLPYCNRREMNSALSFWLCLCCSVTLLIAVWSHLFEERSGGSWEHSI